MDRSSPPRDRGRSLYGCVLSGGPPVPHLGFAAFHWVALPDPEGRALPPESAPDLGDSRAILAYLNRMADPSLLRNCPCLVAYPAPGSTPTSVWYDVLGGRGDVVYRNGSGGGAAIDPSSFRPAPDLAFALGVESPSEMARRLGHSAASTSVYPGPVGACRRPRLIALVGTRPRVALSQLGDRLLSRKEFPQ
jgi:hypothetical protein